VDNVCVNNNKIFILSKGPLLFVPDFYFTRSLPNFYKMIFDEPSMEERLKRTLQFRSGIADNTRVQQCSFRT